MGHWRRATTSLQQFPRVTAALPVRVSTLESETDPTTGDRFFRSAEETTANLSHGGAYLRSWEPLAPGRRIVLAIDVPDCGEIQIVARVAWTHRSLQPASSRDLEAPGYGVEFVRDSSRELACLDDYLKSLERTEPATPSPSTTTTALPGTPPSPRP